MGLIGIIVLVILVISAVLLVLLILIQDEEGEGIGGLFGGGGSTPFGSRAGNVLTRFTAVLAAVFLSCTFILAWINRSPEAGNLISKARQESLQKGQNNSWWVQSPQNSQGGIGGGTESPAGQLPQAAPQGGK
jgi:preprotein translocase subunit SecG